MNIGQALKKLRTDRHLSQKEICQNIITTSYYSKVERGIHNISADNLFIILQQNNVTVQDFLTLLDLNDLYSQSVKTNLSQEIEQAYYQQDVILLNQLKNRVNQIFNRDNEQAILFQYLIKLVIFKLTHDQGLLSDDDKAFFKEQIFNINEWDVFKLGLYNNVIDLYDLESNLLFIHSIVAKPDLIIKEALIVETILINFIGYCIENNHDTYAEPFFAILLSIPTTPNHFFNKNMIMFFKNLLLYRKEPSELFLEKIMTSLDILTFLDMADYGKQMHDFYKKNKVCPG